MLGHKVVTMVRLHAVPFVACAASELCLVRMRRRLSLSFLLVIERLEGARCATARETGVSKVDGRAPASQLLWTRKENDCVQSRQWCTTEIYVFDVTSVAQRSSPWACDSVKIEIKFHLECKLRRVQFMLRQMHQT